MLQQTCALPPFAAAVVVVDEVEVVVLDVVAVVGEAPSSDSESRCDGVERTLMKMKMMVMMMMRTLMIWMSL